MNEIQYIQKRGAKNARYPAYNRLTDQLKAEGFTGDLEALIKLIVAKEQVEIAGGYTQVKELYKELIEKQKDIICLGKSVLTRTEIEDTLLNYRRANNIFEVGDKIVLTVGSRVFIIDHINKKSVWLDSGKDLLDVVNISDILRHATDAEIEANRRLDQ